MEHVPYSCLHALAVNGSTLHIADKAVAAAGRLFFALQWRLHGYPISSRGQVTEVVALAIASAQPRLVSKEGVRKLCKNVSRRQSRANRAPRLIMVQGCGGRGSGGLFRYTWRVLRFVTTPRMCSATFKEHGKP